ncbi:hypothetical protein G4B88_002137 [Cannabis sativa]|uniref:Reverse transcriptase zinc-binding domain-containing protein n=1 Tax=Cannabis sativa TaxID=3483 RepID=A0A7J6F0I4_CANSA|nr:hypothetical protein G4B88_002137 [Cannabis sativa]
MQCKYSIRLGYDVLSTREENVSWYGQVWGRFNIRKHRIIFWLAILERLQTKDKLFCFKVCTDQKEMSQSYQRLDQMGHSTHNIRRACSLKLPSMAKKRRVIRKPANCATSVEPGAKSNEEFRSEIDCVLTEIETVPEENEGGKTAGLETSEAAVEGDKEKREEQSWAKMVENDHQSLSQIRIKYKQKQKLIIVIAVAAVSVLGRYTIIQHMN